MRRLLLVGLFLGVAAVTVLKAEDLGVTSCTTCHENPDMFEAEALEIARGFADDVHSKADISCHDCHGGNPDPALAEDMDAAMDSAHTENPYHGPPKRTQIPSFCGRCHSDPSFMKRFRPDARVDQEREYWTSQHGQALEQGDTKVATCVDCHGTHGIRSASNPDSSVYPTRVAETCRGCHADGGKMAGYLLPNGRPLPIDQYSRWRQSIHAAAMFEREDLTAPTCNDCHGNHGATPPGLDSLTFVCGQCHGREADLFRGSPKHAGLVSHNEYLQESGDESCAACHQAPQAQVTGIRSFGECTSCHGNHGIIRPTMAMFAALPAAPCDFCHQESGLLAGSDRNSARTLEDYLEAKEFLLSQAQSAGLEGEDLYNWLVGSALILPEHTVLADPNSDEPPRLRREFARLFEKFRIGKTYFTYQHPSSGETVRAPIVRCGTCHASGAMVGEETPGAQTGVELVQRMQELTTQTALAERTLLAARRGGVETRDALLDIDQAVDAQIGLEVLAHTFSTEEGSPFMDQYHEGMEHAGTALAKGREALGELASRRRWLAITLIIIIAVSVALALKIRDLSVHRQHSSAE
jgi:nitrate/TMAO reductase-like tetraheme cytochrome c subunit